MEKAGPTTQQQRKKTDWSRPATQDNFLITSPHPLPLTAKQPHLPPCPSLPSKIHVLFFQFNTHKPSQRGTYLSCATSEIIPGFGSLVHPWGRERQHLKGSKEFSPEQANCRFMLHSLQVLNYLFTRFCCLCSCFCIQGKLGISAFVSYD